MRRKRWRRRLNQAIVNLESDLAQWLNQFEENPERIQMTGLLGDLIESRLGRKFAPPGSFPELITQQELLLLSQAKQLALSLAASCDETSQSELVRAILTQVLAWCRYQEVCHRIEVIRLERGLSKVTKAALIVGGIMSSIVIAKKFSGLLNRQDEG